MALQFLNDGYFAGKVGIGTESPDRKLHVNSGSTNIVATFESTDATAAISLQDNSTTNDSKVQIRAIGDDFNIVAGGSQRVTVNSSGNVGIGKTSPSSKLHIKQSVDNIDGGLTWESVDGTQEWSIDANNAGNFRIYKGTTAIARFDSSGNFGIGTTSPTQKLHVAGNARVTGAYYDSNNSPGTANQVLVSTVTGTDWVDGSGSSIIGGPYLPLAGGTMTGSIDFGTNNRDISMTDSAGAVTRVMVLNTSNTMYIGPVDTYAGGSIIYGAAAGVSYQRWYTGASERMRITPSGNVGIGTTIPDSLLHVSADVTGANTGTITIEGRPTGFLGDDIATIDFHNNGSKRANIRMERGNAADDSQLVFSTSDTGTLNDALIINEIGNVGIGTTSPDTNLEIESSTGGVLRLTSSNTTVLTDESIGKIEFKSNDASTGGNNVMGFIDSVATNVGTRYALSFGTGDAAAAVERMRITNLGGISFGSTGTAYGTSGQILKSNANASPTWIDGSAIPGVPAGSGTLNTIPLWTPDGDTLGNSIITQPSTSTIDVDGNILISDTSNDKYFGSNVNLILNADADGNSGSSARNIIFQNRGSEKMRIDSSGNVGIGDTTPSFPLVVSKSSSNTTNSGDGSMRLALSNPDQTNNNYALITFNDGTSQPGSGFMGIQFTDHTNNYGELVFGTRGAGGYGERMRINSSGEVLVNVTSNQTESPLTSRNNGSSIEFGHLNQTSGYYGTVGSMYNNGTPFISFSCDSSSTSAGNNFATRGFKGNVIHGDTGGNLIFSQATNANSASQALTERMRITSGGNVGIGTTSPGSYDTALVGSGHKFLNVQASSTNYAVQTLAGDSGTNGNRLGYLTFVNDNNNATYKYSAWIGSEVEGTTANKQGGRLILSTTSDNSTAGPIERMRIDSSGNVGIGKAPQSDARLHTYRNSTNAYNIFESSTNRWVFGEAGGVCQVGGRYGHHSGIQINTAGNVGIGTGTPTEGRLHVTQSYSAALRTGYFQSSAYSAPHVAYDSFAINQQDVPCLVLVETPAAAVSTHQKLTLTVGDNNAVIRTANTSGGMWFNVNGGISDSGYLTTSGTNALRLLNNGNAIFPGNVGIGTTSPVAAFQVGSITATAMSQVVGKARIVGTNYIPSATQMGTLDIASTTRNSSAPFNQGFGPSLTFSQNISGYVDGYEVVIGAIKSIVTSGSNTGQESAMTFLVNGGTSTGVVERMRISSAGAIKFNNYNSTNNTGTPTYLLGTDASGNVVKTNSAPSPITSQAASLYDLIPNGAFTTTYAFTSTAGTYAEVMQGDDVITANGTYTVQMFVSDYAVGGTQYSETYSGIMSWGSSTNTNDNGGGAISEIVLHRSGHAANQGMTYLRTRETTSSEGNELRLEIMCNRTYTGASNIVFKFVRLI